MGNIRLETTEIDSMAHEYLDPKPDRIVDQKIGEMVADFVISRMSGHRLLELGAGDRIWTPRLLKKFTHVTTVDASDSLLKVLGRELTPLLDEKQWQPVVSLFEDFRPQQKADVVLATYVLEHVADPGALLRLASEHWLENGGRVAIVVPHALSLHRRLAVKMNLIRCERELGDMDRRMGHKHCFTLPEMEKLIVDAELSVVEKKGMFIKLFPNSMLVHCSDKQLAGLFELGLDLPIEYAGVIYFLAEKRS